MIGPVEELARMEKAVTDYTVDGKCSGCGSCCSDFLPVSREEVERIRYFVKRHNIRQHINVVVSGAFMDMTCPFRDGVNSKCDIYSVRPQICRHFQCDQDMDLVNRNKDVLQRKNGTISMRHEFFGVEKNGAFARMINAALVGEERANEN